MLSFLGVLFGIYATSTVSSYVIDSVVTSKINKKIENAGYVMTHTSRSFKGKCKRVLRYLCPDAIVSSISGIRILRNEDTFKSFLKYGYKKGKLIEKTRSDSESKSTYLDRNIDMPIIERQRIGSVVRDKVNSLPLVKKLRRR